MNPGGISLPDQLIADVIGLQIFQTNLFQGETDRNRVVYVNRFALHLAGCPFGAKNHYPYRFIIEHGIDAPDHADVLRFALRGDNKPEDDLPLDTICL